jgi:hypothetical protein
MTSAKKQHRRISPMPVVSSFPPPDRKIVHSECVTRQMTPQEYTEMIAKYGPPIMPLRKTGNHFRGFKKKGEGIPDTVRDKSKADGQRTNDAKGKVEGPGSPKVSGL